MVRIRRDGTDIVLHVSAHNFDLHIRMTEINARALLNEFLWALDGPGESGNAPPRPDDDVTEEGDAT